MISEKSVLKRNKIIEEHRNLIFKIRGIEADVSQMLKDSDSKWRELEKTRNEKLRKVDQLINAYWECIPSIKLSLCPFCNAELRRVFDLIDLNGFWWMDRTQRPALEPESCEHFQLLLGAVNMNGLNPEGGLFESRPGPDVPYVIPRILEMPTIEAVISSIPMKCGYVAYPIAYFSKEPLASGLLTQSWAQKQYRFNTDDGKTGWNIVEDSCDFDLLPWIKSGKVKWVVDGRLNTLSDSPQACPFLELKGMERQQILRHNELSYE